jgi:uncharacterized YigZ family protein
MNDFFTVKSSSEGLYKEKGSKFLGFLRPVSSEENAKEILHEISAIHHKSRHICYALRIGAEGEFERVNDAGEPKGSAGAPILNQIHSSQLTNVMLIVVRYFGGTKLGLGGLNKAYKLAAMDAIGRAEKIKCLVYSTLRISFPYTELGKVQRIIEKNNWNLDEASYKDPCLFSVSSSELSVSEMRTLLHPLSSVEFIG